MLRSEYLYGELDKATAILQKELFEKKRGKAYTLLAELKPSFNFMDFTQEQKDLEWRIDKIKKAIEFCNGQILEAEEVLYEEGA